jgi:hypothetical protein
MPSSSVKKPRPTPAQLAWVQEQLAAGASMRGVAEALGFSQPMLRAALAALHKTTGTQASYALLQAQPYAEECRRLMTTVQSSPGFASTVFASDALRDYLLRYLIDVANESGRDLLQLNADSDLLAMLNPLVADVPLSSAIRKESHQGAPRLMLVRDALAIEPATWALCFALMRDLPALHLACVVCWPWSQRERAAAFVEECRLGAESFEFGPLSRAVQQTLLKSLKKEALGALSYADLEKLLQGLVLD